MKRMVKIQLLITMQSITETNCVFISSILPPSYQ